MSRYRKKPVVIDAVQWTGELTHEMNDFVRSELNIGYDTEARQLIIPTREGTMRADPGDWIIRGVQGEFYPCKPDIFEATYEPAITITHRPESLAPWMDA